MKYLVTGATGAFGGLTLDKLKTLVPVSAIHILARSKKKLRHLLKLAIQYTSAIT